MMISLRHIISVVLLAIGTLSSSATGAAASMVDGATKISFPSTRNGLELFGVGVRKKGPIKIYSVAMYCQSSLKEKLSTLSRTAAKAKALATLRQGVQKEEESSSTIFLLEMAFKVGAEKMASAIADSVTPRHTGSRQDVESLKNVLLEGVTATTGGAAVKGTQLEFCCHPNKGLDVAVNGKEQGRIESPALAKAFCDVYLDDKCVSPALLNSCLENCCAP